MTKKSYTIRDMYKQIDIDISYFRFKRILDQFNTYLLDLLLNRSEGFKMPCRLGYICIVKYKPKTYTSYSLSKDYKTSKDMGKTIYHLNEHSDGYKYRLYWSKNKNTIPDIYKYNLSFVRANKRKLAQLIFNKHDYINIDDIQIYKM